jgi:acyl-CoA thioester hydrolase
LVRQCGLIFVVRRAKLDYLRPARLDEELVVATEGVALAGASVSLRQTFVRAGEAQPLAVLDLLLACVRLADHRPARLPVRWREAFKRLVGSGNTGEGDAAIGPGEGRREEGVE